MMHQTDPAVIAEGLSEASQLHRDLTVNWDAFSDADPLPSAADRDGFPERLEEAGFAELVPVDEDALEEPFAYERGILPGGSMWRLTSAGLAVRSHLQSKETSNG